jgi:hypothetical protein
MNKISAAFMTVLFVSLTAAAYAGADGPVRLSVRIFRIPAEQSFEVVRPDGRGGTVTLHASGNVAAGFPNGTVFVPTEMAANASDTGIGEAVAHAVTFGCGDLVADRVSFRELKSCEFDLDAGRPAGEARFEGSRREGRTDNYELRVERLPGSPEKPLVRFRFSAGWSAQAGSLGVGMSADVISAVAEVPDSKLLLIGAPGEKAVYVLAVCAQPR